MADLGVVGKVYGGPIWLSVAAFPVRNWRLKPPTLSFPAGPQFFTSTLGEWIKQVKGTVRDSTGAPTARWVLALDSKTHMLINRARSNPTTGAFSIGVPNVSSVVVVALPDPGDTANAVVAWKVVPIDLY